MLARNETIFKWALYAGATAVFFLLQGAVLQRSTLWGVIPFVFPLLVVPVVLLFSAVFRRTHLDD